MLLRLLNLKSPLQNSRENFLLFLFYFSFLNKKATPLLFLINQLQFFSYKRLYHFFFYFSICACDTFKKDNRSFFIPRDFYGLSSFPISARISEPAHRVAYTPGIKVTNLFVLNNVFIQSVLCDRLLIF